MTALMLVVMLVLVRMELTQSYSQRILVEFSLAISFTDGCIDINLHKYIHSHMYIVFSSHHLCLFLGYIFLKP
jgi:hypothetical protein